MAQRPAQGGGSGGEGSTFRFPSEGRKAVRARVELGRWSPVSQPCSCPSLHSPSSEIQGAHLLPSLLQLWEA